MELLRVDLQTLTLKTFSFVSVHISSFPQKLHYKEVKRMQDLESEGSAIDWPCAPAEIHVPPTVLLSLSIRWDDKTLLTSQGCHEDKLRQCTEKLSVLHHLQ